MKQKITTIAFDADDTLWINEPYFQEAEKQFSLLFADYMPLHSVSTEMKNLPLYGYGVNGFVLCMIETAGRIIAIENELLQKPMELLPLVQETLEQLKKKGTPDFFWFT